MAGTRLIVHLSFMIPTIVLILYSSRLSIPHRAPLPPFPPSSMKGPPSPTLHVFLTLEDSFDTSISTVARHMSTNLASSLHCKPLNSQRPTKTSVPPPPSSPFPPSQWGSRKGYAFSCPHSYLYIIPYSATDAGIVPYLSPPPRTASP